MAFQETDVHGLKIKLGDRKLEAKAPEGPLADKWRKYKDSVPLVSPANKMRIDVIVVGTGLAGAAAAASLGELGYNVKVFTFHDSPRRAHSIAAQGGINAAKNYRNDGDSVHRLLTPSKVEIIAPAKPTFTAWQKSHRALLTNASRKACLSLGNTVAC
jgi:NADPH-dependent 2,4-dienoyl-CoA reductase/sulfur reductase-like enzyme